MTFVGLEWMEGTERESLWVGPGGAAGMGWVGSGGWVL